MSDGGEALGRVDLAAPAAPEAPAPAGPGRLAMLSEVAVALADAPGAPATLQLVVDGAARATGSDAARIVLHAVGADGPATYTAGLPGPPDGGPRLAVTVGEGADALGELTLVRAGGRAAYAEADALFARTVAAQLAAALDPGEGRDEGPAERGLSRWGWRSGRPRP